MYEFIEENSIEELGDVMEVINAIMKLMNIHNELYNLEKFGNEIDVSDSYTNLYGGYPDMINAHSIRDLRKFVLMLSKTICFVSPGSRLMSL